MKLTIEQVSKLTKLSIPTLRVYVSRQKLGTKEGNNRFFSQADVQKLLKGTRRSSGTAEKKPATKSSAKSASKTAKKPAKAAKTATRAAAKATPKPAPAPRPASRPAPQRPVPAAPGAELKVKPPRPSFWSRIFGARRPKQRITVMDAKTTK